MSMKKFVELIQRVHKERFSVVMNKIVREKIPVAFFSLLPIKDAIKTVEQINRQGININALITLDATPPRQIWNLT